MDDRESELTAERQARNLAPDAESACDRSALSTRSSGPSAVAVADIPAEYLVLYQRAAARYGIDWAILAAIGKIECDHGRGQAPGCHPTRRSSHAESVPTRHPAATTSPT